MTKEEILSNLAARDPLIIGDHSPNLKPGHIIKPAFAGDVFVGDENIRLMVVRKTTKEAYCESVGAIAAELIKASSIEHFYEVTTD